MRGAETEGIMSLHEDSDDYSFADYNHDDVDDIEDLDQKKRVKRLDDIAELDQRKRVKRLIEERLERKRLKDEFKDDFDEISGEFDWDELDK